MSAAGGDKAAGDSLAPQRAAPVQAGAMRASAGDACYLRGDYRSAWQHYAEAVRLRPSAPEYHYKLAMAGWNSGQQESVERHFHEAIRLAPNFAAAHDGLAVMYLHWGNLDAAMTHSSKAVALEPSQLDFVVTRASVLATAGKEQDAWELIQPSIDAGSCDWRLALAFARLAPKLGQLDRALLVLQRALESPQLPQASKSHLYYSAASLLDRLGRYDEAFEHARLAKQSARRPHDPAVHSHWISRQIAFFSADRLPSLPRATHGSRRPVFIVGMPRSGTSLVEQILASHLQVFGAGELPTLGRIARTTPNAEWSRGVAYPECLEFLSVSTANQLGAEYLAHLQALNSQSTYVTDKTPLNFLDLGFAQLILPQCHIIHCVRNRLDTCLSCYLTEFASGHAFTGDLSHLSAFFTDYRRLMEHWKQVLTLPILEVRYEELVYDPATQVRRLLAFLDLTWEDRCLRFFENPRRVNTASMEQVRQPIYSSSVGRWKNYERHLSQLIAAQDQ